MSNRKESRWQNDIKEVCKPTNDNEWFDDNIA